MEELITAIIEQALVDYATDNHKVHARMFLEHQTLVDVDLKPIMDTLDAERESYLEAVNRVQKEYAGKTSYYYRRKFWDALGRAKREAAPITYRLMDHLYA